MKKEKMEQKQNNVKNINSIYLQQYDDGYRLK